MNSKRVTITSELLDCNTFGQNYINYGNISYIKNMLYGDCPSDHQ